MIIVIFLKDKQNINAKFICIRRKNWKRLVELHLCPNINPNTHKLYILRLGLWCLTPLSSISLILWRSVLLEDKLYHIMLYRIHHAWAGFELPTVVVIGTGCIGSYKSNYHTVTTTTAPFIFKDTPLILYIYIISVRLSEWCCSVTMVWVQIPSREEQKFDSSKI